MDAPPVRSLGSLLSKVKWLVDARLTRKLREAELSVTPEQWSILVAIHAGPGSTQAEIAARVFKDKTNVARILDLLDRRGWTERREDERDRRAYRVHLTRAGQTVTRTIIPIAHALNAEATSCLAAGERDLLLDLLEKVKDHLQA